jgi:hypothetical protein
MGSAGCGIHQRADGSFGSRCVSQAHSSTLHASALQRGEGAILVGGLLPLSD